MTLERTADNHEFTMYYDSFLRGTRPPDKLVYQLDVIKSGEYTLVDKLYGKLSQGSMKQIELVRTRDGHQFTMCCQNFCHLGNRPPEKLLYQLDVIKSGEFTLVEKSDGRLGQGSNQKIELVRMRDGHQFTMKCANFCRGCRPPEKLLYQLDVVKSGEFTLVEKSDGELAQGTHKKIELVRMRDGHQFTMKCSNFCTGCRPPEKLLHQLDVVKSGEFTLVDKSDGELGQGSHKKIELVRTRDGHQFTIQCSRFFSGQRPPEKLVYQLSVISSKKFKLVNESDGQLGQGSRKHIELVRTCDQLPVTVRCDAFCSCLCFHCLDMISQCTYAPNTCASCWCIKFPGAALAASNIVGHKTEILVAAMLEAHLGRVRKEHPTRDKKREDVVLLSTNLAIAIDGVHHFKDFMYAGNNHINSCAVKQSMDTNKTRWWLEDHPDSSYVRFRQDDCWKGYPVNVSKPITFDFVSATNYINQRPEQYGGKVVFLEKMDKKSCYMEHRRLLDVDGIRHVTLDPRTIPDYGPYRIVEDKRYILST